MKFYAIILLCLINLNHSLSILEKRNTFAPVIENIYTILTIYYPLKISTKLETSTPEKTKDDINEVVEYFKFSDFIFIHAIHSLIKLNLLKASTPNKFKNSKEVYFDDPFSSLFFCLLMNGKHNNFYTAGIVSDELEKYKETEAFYTFILGYKFELIPESPFKIWQHYLINQVSSVEEIFKFLIQPLFEQMISAEAAEPPSIKPVVFLSSNPISKRRKTKSKIRPKPIDKTILNDLDIRRGYFMMTEENGSKRPRNGGERIEYLHLAMMEYKEGKKLGVRFTENTRTWIRQVCWKPVECFRNRCGSNAKEFVENHGINWTSSGFQCKC